MKGFWRFILCTLLRWKIEGNFPADIKKYVIIVAPHTHWLDFPMALLVRFSTGLKANFIGKASLFKPPFGFLFRVFGGAPVDRTKSSNKVDSIVALFDSKDEFVLSLSPEGTRKKVEVWKTGFYHIAKGAKVPIVRGSMDFENKVFAVYPPFYPTNDKDADILELRKVFEGVKGKVAENS